MSNYTAEQVENAAEILEQDQNAPSWKRLSEMLRDYAAHLRERESDKAVVTHTMIREAKDAFENSTAKNATGWWRSALEAVAPMLASNVAWKAIVEECMLTESVTPIEDDPRKTIKDLIDWHLMVDRELSNASARVPEGYVLHRLGTEPDETKYRLMREDIECFHAAMDDYGAPREVDGRALSMFGRSILWCDRSIDAALASLRGRIQDAMLAAAPEPEKE